MIKVGERAPEFSLLNQDARLVRLGEVLRAGAVVLYFYPADFTPGCTKEACSFRERHEDLLEAGLALLGVSPQDPASHRRFREEHRLPFDLLSDEKKEVVAAYGCTGPFGLGVRRATFLIEPDGTVADVEVADFRIGRHEAFIDRVLSRYSG